MKLVSLVIAHQRGAVNTFPSLVHTALHTMEVGFNLRHVTNPREVCDHGMIGDWGEVVTRMKKSIICGTYL